MWIYELRTNQHFTLKKNSLKTAGLGDFIRRKDDSLEDIDSVPPPDVIATEITGNLRAALEAFQAVSNEPATTAKDAGR